MTLLKHCMLGVAALTLTSAASAAGFPSRPVTIVVPYAAGGSNDLIARVVGVGLGKQLGVTVVVNNVPGASGTIGSQRVVDAEPDGYTILLGSPSEISIAHQINPAVRYNGQRDLAPVGKIGAQPLVLVTAPKLNIKTPDAFVKYARTNEVRFGTSGIGTPLHLAGELVNSEAGTKMLHVPYKGGAPAIADIMGGQIEAGVLVFSTALPHIRSGKLQGIGVTSAKRAEAAPELPALAENAAMSKVDIVLWFGLWAPAKTDAAVVKKLGSALEATLKDAETSGKLREAGLTVDYAGADAFKAYLVSETAKFGTIAKSAKLD